MGPTGRLVTIKRSGADGPHFPLSLSTCWFGRGIECDIRIQLPVVSKQHCKIEINGQEAMLFNFSSTNPTQVNGSTIDGPVQLKHGDVITVVDRSFRYENESHEDGRKSTEFPGQRRKQESLHRVSRSSLSSDPDGKLQDSDAHSRASEDSVSGKPLKNVQAVGTVSGGCEDRVASRTPNVVRPSELAGGNSRNTTDPTGRDSKEDFSITLASCKGDLKPLPSTRGLENGANNESPFKKLYESMKEELDAKSEKGDVLQSGKKSGTRSHRPPEKECSGGLQGRTQVPGSLKSRPRSGRSTQMKADPALGEQGISQTEDRRQGEEAVETPKETRSPIVPPEMTATKTLAQRSPQTSRKRQHEDMTVAGGSASVNLDQKEGFRTDNKTFTPRKSLTRNQTPAKVENADNFGDTPENLFSKRRRSIPTSVDILTPEPETQNHAILAPLPIQVERKIPNSSVHQPEKAGAAVGRMHSALPGRSSVDTSNFGDSINKTEGTPLKRRRVSFGGCLKPELFDENLPPNTPLKRGETPRRSLVSHTPPVLKKIIKDRPQPSGKEDSSGLHLEVTAQPQFAGSPARDPTRTSPGARDPRRRSPKASSVSGGSKSHHTDVPKRGGRKSGGLLSKRTSIDRSQHDILQRIYSKRRSGASEANLVVAKSWADVVKLGAKQTQAKAVKHGPQRQLSKRPRKANTPKKPVSGVHSEFSTGHANSPCTIIIGKAHLEKVNVPARPYRMLNNFVINKKVDFNEDLSGKSTTSRLRNRSPLIPLHVRTWTDAVDVYGGEQTGGSTIYLEEEPSALRKPTQMPGESTNSHREPGGDDEDINLFNKTPGQKPNPAVTKSKRRPRTPKKKAHSLEDLAGLRELFQTPNHTDKPMADDPTTKAPCKSPLAELVNTPASRRRLCKTPLQKVDLEEEASALQKSTQMPGERPHEHREPVGGDEDIGLFKETPKQKLDPAENVAGSKRRSRTPKKKVQSLEDLVGLKELFQTPEHTPDPVTVDQTTRVPCKSPQAEPVNTPASRNRRLKTPQKVDLEEEPSALRKSTQMSGESPHEHREPVGGDEDIRLFKETPKQELDPAENVAGSKRRPRTPKKKVHSLEDLDGLRGLFQTPDHTDKPMTGDQTTKAPCKSLLAGPGNTPASQKRWLKTPPQKVGLEEKPSSLRKPTQMPGESTNSHREPGGDDEDINLFNKTPGQKPNPAVTKSKKRPRTPKKKAHSLEDLAGLRELFQTPNHTDKPMADDPATKAPCKSPLAELLNTPASRRRLCKTPLQKVDLEEEASALQKSTQMPGERPHEHREPVGGDEVIGLFKETPKQKLDPAENVAGSKRRPRTPKKKVQSLEDLVGLKELFQTPSHTDKPMAGDQTTKAPCQSPLPGPGNTPASQKRRLETPPQKVGLEEEPPALGKSTQMPGESPHEHTESGGEDKDIKLFNKTPEQKLKPADNVTGSKRWPRTPQKKVQSLEDLVGLKELFQTPEQTKKTTAVVKTAVVPCKSPLAETVNIPTHMKTRLKVALGKVTIENELSAVTKPTHRPEEATRTHREPVGEDEDIRLFKETPKQKLKPEEDVTGSKRQPRTPKKKVQSLEDLVGLKELFQTPDPGTGDQTTKVPCKSPRAEPVNTPASGKRWLETPPQKVDLEEEPSALRKPTRMPGESPHEHREPGGKDEDINLFKETLKRKLNPTENVTGSKKQPRTPRGNIQSVEDLVGLKELFQTPNHTDKPMTGDQTTKAPCQSPLAGPGNKLTNRRRRLKTPPQKVDLEEEPSALRKPTQLPGESPHEHREPVGGDADIGLFKETPKPKLEPVRNVSRSKRRPRTPKKKVQSLEDLAGLKELLQTTDPVTGDRTTKAPFQSPLAGPGNKPTNRRRRLKTPPQKADLKEEPSALRKPTQTPEESTHSLRESGGDDKDVKLFNRTAKQKLGPTENVTGRKNRPRAPNPNQPLEDLAGFRESFPRPDHTKQRGDAGSIQGAPKQTPDGGKPVKPLARVRRAPRGKPVEDLAGHRDPVKTRSESSVSPSPKRKRGNEGGGPGTKRLRSVTPAQATAEEKPPLKKRRGAPREGRDPPEPLTAKRKLRIVAERMEVPEDLTSGKRESRTEGREVGRTTASPQQAMSLRSRRPNKTKLEEQRPEPVKAAEKVKTDRNDKKPRKTSQQTKPQSPEGRAKSSTPAGRVRASRMCLRSTRPRKVPLPDVAEEKQREKGVGVHVKNQEEEVTQRSEAMSLRSRKVKIPPGGNALESESQQQVTRSAKRCAGNVKKDEDNACIKKIRTRSRRDNEDV
uniref:proliferation marker protein Ki-67 n=1 Tax=Panthera onca TaxID=9690 RepID=UPI002953C8E3|nr:proliferation marker protein Ki-67 [Panthera onca]